MYLLKQSTEAVATFLMVQDTDYATAATGKTPSVTLSKNGGSFVAASGSVTEIGSGWYKFTLTTAETNTEGDLIISATATDCAPWRQVRQVVGDLNDFLTTDVDATLSVTERNAIADHILRRDLSNTEAASGPDTFDRYSALGALLRLVGVVSTSGGTVTVKETDGSTTAYTLNITTSASAELTTGQS